MLLKLLKDVFSSRQSPSDDEMLALANSLMERSLPGQAGPILNTLLQRSPDNTDALALRGMARRATGRPQEAVADLRRAVDLAPENPFYLTELAKTWAGTGDTGLAIQCCERARLADPDFVMAFSLLAHLKLGGTFYLDLLARIVGHVQPRTYVEIGVFQGDSLRLVKPPAVAVGIDPEPQISAPLAKNLKVFAETSDSFFASHDLRAELGGLPVDLAFVDGMHHFEFALRDFANLERCSTRASTILIHDCYPVDRESAERAPRFVNWSGDIWRLIVLLKKYRPDLSISTLGAPPTGLGVIRNLDPDSRVLVERHDQLCEEFLALDYSYLDEDMPGKLNLVSTDWENIRTLLQ